MEWFLVGVVVWLLLSRRRRRRMVDAAGSGVPADVVRSEFLPDGREVVNVEGSLFAPSTPDEPGWTWVAVEGVADAQLQHTTTVGEVLAGSRNAGGGRAGTTEDMLVEAVPVILMPTGTPRRIAAVDVYATGGRLGHLPPDAVARHGAALLEVVRVEGRPAGVEARILRAGAGRVRSEVLLPDRFEPTPPG